MGSDLRDASYEEIVEFVFNRLPVDEVDDKWYWNLVEEVTTQPEQAIAFLTRLCETSGELVSRFTLRQIAEGLGYVFGAGGRYEFYNHLWNAQIGWPQRLGCIRSIPQLYKQSPCTKSLPPAPSQKHAAHDLCDVRISACGVIV